MAAGLRITAGPVLTRAGDLAALLTDLQDGDVLFIDEIHRLHRSVEEMLYSAMEDGRLDILIGKGPTARSIRLELPKFTLVGATTRTGLVSGPLRDRFGFVGRLDLYDPPDLRAIVERSARILKVEIDAEGADPDLGALPRHAPGGQPPAAPGAGLRRGARRGHIDGATASEGLELFGVDALGLDKVDRAILVTLCTRFGGQPVGLTTLGAVRRRGDRHDRGRLRAVPAPEWADPAHGPGTGGRRRGRGPIWATTRRRTPPNATNTPPLF